MHVPERLTLLRVSAPDSGDPWVSKTRAFGVGLAWHTLSTCDFEHVVHHDGLVDHYASSVALYPDYGVGVFLFTNGGSADLGGIGNELVQRMQKSGALTQRVRVATRAPQLDAAMDRLLAVMHRWDAQRYAAMLSAPHQQNVKAEDERAELAGYLALHGDCTRGAITQFVGPTEARYALQCQRGQLEMWLRLEAQSGLIAGFSGVSKGVAETPGSRAAAKKALALFHRWSAQGFSSLFAPSFLSEKETRDFAAKYDARHGVCSLGDAIERDGNGWQRFAVSCQHGNDVLSIKLEKDRITGLLLRPKDTDARCEAR